MKMRKRVLGEGNMFGVSEEDHKVQGGPSSVSKESGRKGLAQKGNV